MNDAELAKSIIDRLYSDMDEKDAEILKLKDLVEDLANALVQDDKNYIWYNEGDELIQRARRDALVIYRFETVAGLIIALQRMPQDAPVSYIWDGACRSDAKGLYLAKGDGTERLPPHVVITDGEVAYYDSDRPADAPSEKDNPYWEPWES